MAVVGTGAAPYEGREPQRWSAAFDGGVGVAFAIGSRTALVTELHALVASPHPVVRFADTRAATIGYPSVILSWRCGWRREEPDWSFAAALVWPVIGCGEARLDAVGLPPRVLADGLVAHWTLDEGGGTIVSDTSGNGHDGQLTGGAWLATAQFGGGLRLAAGDTVAIPGFPARHRAGAFPSGCVCPTSRWR